MLYVYESSPTCCLKYILCIDKIVEYPTMIEESGIGNKNYTDDVISYINSLLKSGELSASNIKKK